MQLQQLEGRGFGDQASTVARSSRKPCQQAVPSPTYIIAPLGPSLGSPGFHSPPAVRGILLKLTPGHAVIHDTQQEAREPLVTNLAPPRGVVQLPSLGICGP